MRSPPGPQTAPDSRSASPTAARSAPGGCCWPRAWTTWRRRSPGWPNCGDGRRSTARSATAREVRDQPLAVLASGDRAVHMALMLRGWTDDVVISPTAQPVSPPTCRPTSARSPDSSPRAANWSPWSSPTVTGWPAAASWWRQPCDSAATWPPNSASPWRRRNTIAEDAVAVDAFPTAPRSPACSPPATSARRCPQVAAAISAGSLSAAAVVQSLLADDVGLPVPPWPNQKENADVAA